MSETEMSAPTQESRAALCAITDHAWFEVQSFNENSMATYEMINVLYRECAKCGKLEKVVTRTPQKPPNPQFVTQQFGQYTSQQNSWGNSLNNQLGGLAQGLNTQNQVSQMQYAQMAANAQAQQMLQKENKIREKMHVDTNTTKLIALGHRTIVAPK